MLKKLFMPNKKPEFVFEMPMPARSDLHEIQKSYARLFAAADGQKVLAHLQQTIFMRALPADASDEQIRYIEGQRAIVAQILRHIIAGRGLPQNT